MVFIDLLNLKQIYHIALEKPVLGERVPMDHLIFLQMVDVYK